MEIEGYTKELAAQGATTDLLPLTHDLAAREVARAKAVVADIKKRASEARRQETEEQIREAAMQKAALADPSLRDLANVNEELALERQKLIEKTKQIVEALGQSHKKLARIEKDFEGVKDKLKSVGRTKTIALFLKAQRLNLPDVHDYLESIEDRQPETLKTQMRIFELVEKRAYLANREDLFGTARNEEEGEQLPSEKEERNQVERELLQTQKKYIDQLARDYYHYFSILVELDTTEQALVDKTDAYRACIDEQVLWICSSLPIWDGTNWHDALDLRRVFEADFWRASPVAIAKDLKSYPLLWVGALLVLVLLLLARRRTKPALSDLGQRAEGAGMQRFFPTVQATLLTALLTIPAASTLAFCPGG